VLTWFLGIPDHDVERFSGWSLGLITVGSPEEELALQMEIRSYYLDLIECRKLEPGDDLASQLLVASIDGRPVTDDEILDIYLTLTGAGGETTAAAVNNAFVLLERHPEIREQLVADATLIPGAIEELLRYVTPVYGFGRTTTRDVDVSGTTIPAGERVWLSWLSANWDPDVFACPAQIDVRRQNNRHLAFGAGVHRCPGAPLARLELRVMLEELLARIPHYTITDHDAARIVEGVTRVVRSVPVTFDPVRI
jgi:cytochrome P450